MKKIKSWFAILCYLSLVQAQIDTSKVSAGWGNLDYSVPESPAFKLLGANPDNILQPTSVRSAAISVGNYFAANNNVIPKNLAAEISPLLLNGNASLNEYNAYRFLYRTRLSFGTTTPASGGNYVAEGIRITIFDYSDLRADSRVLALRYTDAKLTSLFLDRAIDYYKSHNPKDTNTKVGLLEKYNQDSSLHQTIDSIEHKLYYDSVKTSIVDSISYFRNELWNAPIWEMGAAVSQASNDSLVKHLKLAKVGFWSTIGIHFLKNDQLLFGVKVEVDDSTKWVANGSIGARYYYGSNQVKAFLEGEYNYINNQNSGTVSLGCQFNITNGLWGQFSINGVIDNSGNISYNPNFNISFGTPDKGKSQSN